MTEPILTFDKTRRTNAELIVACRDLGYLSDEMLILDATYGKGRFWKRWQPSKGLRTNDWDETTDAVFHHDYRCLPTEWTGFFDAVVFDPEYKLSGNALDHQSGPAALNADYGVARAYRPIATRTEGWLAGFDECVRVCKPGGHVLVKIMDQVVSGARRFLAKELWEHAKSQPVVQVDELYLYGVRAQPARTRKCSTCRGSGTVWRMNEPQHGPHDGYPVACDACDGSGRVQSPQVHAQQSLSTLMVFRKGAS
jgi:hypothetical protein